MGRVAQSQAAAAYGGWKNLVAKYQQPDVKISIWQLVNSFGGFFICWGLMYLSLQVGYWLTLLLAIPTSGFLVRIFIIQHDCGHGSFFKSHKANDAVGTICGVFTLVAYRYWRKQHAIHHAHHAELEERGTGDVWTLTVEEYLAAPVWKRIAYRIFRNPLFLFGLAPAVNYLMLERIPIVAKREWRNGEAASVWWTDLAILGVVALMSLLIGFWTFVAIQLPIVLIAGSVGTWLFYVQHQYERTYWEHTPAWDFTLAAMEGSSFYRLPKVLQWFTGNIGFHHIHHLSPRIPNYKLEQCHKENPLLQRVTQLTLWQSLQTINLTLWDEQRRQLVSFREAFEMQKQAATA